MAAKKRSGTASVALERIVDEIKRAGKMKRIPRMGWRIRGVVPCESVADHSFRVIYIAMLLGDALAASGREIDTSKVLRIAILHELPESMLTDLAKEPVELLGKAAKHRAESQAMTMITRDLPGAQEYFDLWLEFEENRTLEGITVRVADRVDMIVQAWEYGEIGWRNLEDFWKNPANFEDFDIPLFRDLFTKLRAAGK